MASLWAVGQALERKRALKVMGVASVPQGGAKGAQAGNLGDASPLIKQIRKSVNRLLELAQPSPLALRRAAFACGAVSVTAALLALFFDTAAVLLAMPLALLTTVWWLRARAFKRAEAFERDYPALLLALASSVRTGLDPLVALQRAQGLFSKDAEIGKELDKFNASLAQGCSEELAIRRFGSSIEHPDIRLFQTAFMLARKEGSSLAACLHRLTRVTRSRQSFRRKVRASVAMQKLSTLGIAGCAVVIVSIQGLMNLEALRMAAAHPLGARMLLAGGALMVIGLTVMLRMSRARI